MIQIFHLSQRRDAHSEFQKWRKKNPQGYFLNRKTERNALLHRSACSHPGDTEWSEKQYSGASLGKRMKVCGDSVEAITTWAKQNKVVVKACESCSPGEAKEALSTRKTVLLTWNPAKSKWKNFERDHAKIRTTGKAEISWSCYTSKVCQGDRVFLLKQGSGKRGIMAAGYVGGKAFEDFHHGDKNRRQRYVPVQWTALLHPEKESILSREVLDRPPFSAMHWNTQVSGVSIPPKIATALEERWSTFLSKQEIDSLKSADEVTDSEDYWEGTTRKITVNAYERDVDARNRCLELHGRKCSVCCMCFREAYGELGDGFIHVHHLRPLATIGKGYKVDPKEDLRPVCPNCHAMLHRSTEVLSILELQKIIESQRKLLARSRQRSRS